VVYTKRVQAEKKRKEAIPKVARVTVPSVGVAVGLADSNGLSGLESTADLGLSPTGGFPFLV
jgi:hypothetical protein